MKNLTLPLLLIALGAAWLLHNVGLLPDLRSVGAIALAGAGLAVLFLEGITKQSVVSGPMLIAGGATWYARDHNLVSWSVLGPLLLIVFGVCLFISRLPSVPASRGRGEQAAPVEPRGAEHGDGSVS